MWRTCPTLSVTIVSCHPNLSSFSLLCHHWSWLDLSSLSSTSLSTVLVVPVIPRMLSKALRTLIRESDDVTAVVKRRWWPKSNTSATTNNIEADPLPSQPSVSQSPLLGLQLTFLGGWSPNRGGSKLAKTSRGGSTLAKETAWEPVCLVMTMMPIWWWWFDKSKKTRCGVSVGPSHHHHPFLAQRGLSATSAKQN